MTPERAFSWLVAIKDHLFYPLYIAIAIATFRHSAAGFASIANNNIWPYVAALAIDIGMMLSASWLRRSRNIWLIVGLLVSALASTYTQWLHAVTHAAMVPVAPGAKWLGDVALSVVNIRVVILPALLPLLSVVYAFSAQTPANDNDLDAEIMRIRAEFPKLTERATQLWQLSEDGYGRFTVKEVAEWAQCSQSTAEKARIAK